MATFIARPNKDGSTTVQAKIRVKDMPHAFRSFKATHVDEAMKEAEEWAQKYEEALLATKKAVSKVGLEALIPLAKTEGCTPTTLAIRAIEDYLNRKL